MGHPSHQDTAEFVSIKQPEFLLLYRNHFYIAIYRNSIYFGYICEIADILEIYLWNLSSNWYIPVDSPIYLQHICEYNIFMTSVLSLFISTYKLNSSYRRIMYTGLFTKTCILI